MVEFTVYGIPAPAGSKRGFKTKTGRVVITDASARSRPWKAQVADAAGEAMTIGSINGHPTYAPSLEGPLVLEIDFVMPRPKGHFGKRGLLPSAPVAPAVKPDLLKLARAVEDALSSICYRDDAQVVREVLTKSYGDPARVVVRVYPLDNAVSDGDNRNPE